MCSLDARNGRPNRPPRYEKYGIVVKGNRRCSLVPAGLTFHGPLAIFTIKLLQSRLVLSRTSFLFP